MWYMGAKMYCGLCPFIFSSEFFFWPRHMLHSLKLLFLHKWKCNVLLLLSFFSIFINRSKNIPLDIIRLSVQSSLVVNKFPVWNGMRKKNQLFCSYTSNDLHTLLSPCNIYIFFSVNHMCLSLYWVWAGMNPSCKAYLIIRHWKSFEITFSHLSV